jgi:hypothetical protein
MEKLTSASLVDAIKTAGIEYVPATKMYYQDYPYRITFKSLHSNVNYKNRKRFATSIDLADPEAARAKLDEKYAECIKLIENREYIIGIYDTAERQFATSDWKKKGGANGDYTIYLKRPKDVWKLVENCSERIVHVTGPLNEKHLAETESSDKVMRDSLYYNKYRYQLTFNVTTDFKDSGAAEVWEILNTMDEDTYRAHKIYAVDKEPSPPRWMRQQSVGRGTRPGPTSVKKVSPVSIHGLLNPRSQGRYNTGQYSRPEKASLYLTNADDFFLIKLQLAEYVCNSNQVVMPEEIN